MIEGGLDYLVEGVDPDSFRRREGQETWTPEEWVNDSTREMLHDLLENVPEARRALPDRWAERAAIRLDTREELVVLDRPADAYT